MADPLDSSAPLRDENDDPAAGAVPDLSFGGPPPDYGPGGGALPVARADALEDYSGLRLLGGNLQPTETAAAPARQPAPSDGAAAVSRGVSSADAAAARHAPEPAPGSEAPSPPVAPRPPLPAPPLVDGVRRADDTPPAGPDVPHSLQTAMGITGVGDRIDWELEAELLSELAEAGVDLTNVRARYDVLSAEDRRSYRVFQLQQGFRATLDRLQELTLRAGTRVEHTFGERLQVFEQVLRRVAAAQLLLEEVEVRLNALRTEVGRRVAEVETRFGVVDKRVVAIDEAVQRAHERVEGIHNEILSAAEALGLTSDDVRRASFIGAVGGAVVGGLAASVVLFGLFLLLS